MGYLDNLSPEQPEPEKKKFRFSNTPKKRSGGIPSGRGPDASYLETMAAGGSGAPPNDKEDAENGDSTAFTTSQIPAGWSDVYLTEFLDGKDDSRTDIHNLLTQRSIQSFMWLLETCRVRRLCCVLYFVLICVLFVRNYSLLSFSFLVRHLMNQCWLLSWDRIRTPPSGSRKIFFKQATCWTFTAPVRDSLNDSAVLGTRPSWP
jgi:hypothetical protein